MLVMMSPTGWRFRCLKQLNIHISNAEYNCRLNWFLFNWLKDVPTFFGWISSFFASLLPLFFLLWCGFFIITLDMVSLFPWPDRGKEAPTWLGLHIVQIVVDYWWILMYINTIFFWLEDTGVKVSRKNCFLR
jgi:hypothetical protein